MNDSLVAQLQATLKLIPAHTWYAAPSGALTFVNERCADYLGLAKDHPLRFGIETDAAWDSHLALLHPDDYDESRRVWSTCLRTGSAGEVSFRVLSAHGGYHWFLSRAEPIRANDETLPYWIGINLDIEERKRAEGALQVAQAELAHVMRVLTMGELAASIAHEVNQPLAAIVTSASACKRWLAAEPPEMAQARRALERIMNDSKRASEVIDRVRALVKRQPPRNDAVDVNASIRDLLPIVRPEIAHSGVQLRTRFASELPLVQGDRVQLQQVILNLIVNAIEAMRSVVERPRELVIVTGRHESGGVLVEVRDSGEGLDPASVDHLFETFFSTKPEGLGMGLAICRSIVEAHGGKLWTTLNAPHGAVFQFFVPAEERAA
jgi:PAS domain S-box-containing protein